MGDYTVDRCRKLEVSGFSPFFKLRERRIVSVAENGKTYKAEVADGLFTMGFQIDGEIIKAGARCDKYIAALKDNSGVSVFIELKGKDISHAIDQLEATLKSRQFSPFPRHDDKVRARIVTANCGPKSSSKAKLEEARVRFKMLYNTELKVLKTLQTDTCLSI